MPGLGFHLGEICGSMPSDALAMHSKHSQKECIEGLV